MSIKVVFFAQVREQLGLDAIEIEQEYPTVDCLRQALMERGEPWVKALGQPHLLAAVNHSIVGLHSPLTAGDEVAFFPPVTGG